MRILNHVGVSVTSLERSIQFYRDLLGMEVVRERAFSGDQYERILGLQGARGRLAILQAGTLRIELFEFTHPSPKSSEPLRPVCDHGITHFCIEVSDLQHEYERLKAAGVSFHVSTPESTFPTNARHNRDGINETRRP